MQITHYYTYTNKHYYKYDYCDYYFLFFLNHVIFLPLYITFISFILLKRRTHTIIYKIINKINNCLPCTTWIISI